MENVGIIWRQRDVSILLEEHGWECPIGRSADIVLTTARIAVVATNVQRESTGKWIIGGALAGPIGILVAGATGAIWNAFKAAQQNRTITTEMLDGLVANRIAICAAVKGLECEVHQMKRTWFAPIKATSRLAFYGTYAFGQTTMRGGVFAYFDEPAVKMAKLIERSLPVKVKVQTGVDWVEFEKHDPSLEARALGRQLGSTPTSG